MDGCAGGLVLLLGLGIGFSFTWVLFGLCILNWFEPQLAGLVVIVI